MNEDIPLPVDLPAGARAEIGAASGLVASDGQ